MTLTMIAVHLVIAVAILMFLIIALKINATISMIVATLYMGIACGMGLVDTVATTAAGFGIMMRGIGLPIGFGIILGQLLSDCGGANVIAKKITSVFPQSKAFIALLITAAILSIPVFADVTFVILMPIGIAIAKQTNKPVALAVSIISIGAVATHCFVPPTPGPLSAAEIVGADVGMMILIGLVVTIVSLTFGYFITTKLILSGKFFKESDNNPNAVLIEQRIDSIVSNTPSFGVSMVPILLPVAMILIGTGTAAFNDTVPPLVTFLGDKMIALLIGAICSYVIAFKYLSKEDVEKSVTRALESSGLILLVTGAGGSLGEVIKATGIGDLLQEVMGASTNAVVSTLIIIFFIGLVFRISLGSGTVASITAITIMAPVALSLPVHPVYPALAALCGGMTFPHVNDSGFWVMTNLGGLTVTGGVKAYSVPVFITSLFAFAVVLIMATVFPMA